MPLRSTTRAYAFRGGREGSEDAVEASANPGMTEHVPTAKPPGTSKLPLRESMPRRHTLQQQAEPHQVNLKETLDSGGWPGTVHQEP